MKVIPIIAVLVIGGIIFYVTGGGALLGVGGTQALPETTEAPNATFLGDEQSNPFFAEPQTQATDV